MPTSRLAEVIDLQSNTAVLSDWWNFQGCRLASPPIFTGSADFTGLGVLNCVDPWQGWASGGVDFMPENAIYTPPLPTAAAFGRCSQCRIR